MNKTYNEDFTIEQWLKCKDNPRQRNTELRAGRAKKKHLCKWKSVHNSIAVSRLGGEDFLNDSHTRRYLYEDGHFDGCRTPKVLQAFVIECDTIEEVAENYKCYDSKQSVEKASDEYYSQMKELGYVFKSKRFEEPTSLGAIQTVCCDGTIQTTEDWMTAWFQELKTLDGYMLPKGNTSVGATVTAGLLAACVMLINQGYDVKDFILDIRNDLGNKTGSKRCGVSWFIKFILDPEENTSGYNGYKNVAKTAIACFHLYLNGNMSSRMPEKEAKQLDRYWVVKSKRKK